MTAPATDFSTAFNERFQKNTEDLPQREIPLFRAFHNTLASLADTFHIEEYHGGSHQVFFTGNGSFARSQARCELSDLMIIAFSTSEVRLSYIQAKSEKVTPTSITERRFSTNLEQWFLLSSRPRVNGVGKFNPPPELLSHSILPSVGSFVFFFKDSKGYQTHYSSASHLKCVRFYTKRYGKVKSNGPFPAFANTSGFEECLVACDNRSFAESLYRLKIGTPIDPKYPQCNNIRNWLAANISGLIEKEKNTDNKEVAMTLIETLKPEKDEIQYGSIGSKKLIILRTDSKR